LEWIGAYGLAIIVLTVLIKLLLAPLYQLQLSMSRKSMMEQRKLAPEIAKLKKKYKNDPQKLNTATMDLYREHGVNPLGGLAGCLPALAQFPILTALYWAFLKFHVPDAHFLFIPSLLDAPNKHPLIAGIPLIPSITFLIIPLLAALSTYVQSKMMQQPPNPLASEQEMQTQQMTQSMSLMMPLMIAYFAIVTPAGLGLYWFISNCVAIIQQYFVTGWGQLWGPGK
jgi:YidC/Oxa1 family membrane protein insertase